MDDAREIADYVRRAQDFEEAVRLVKLYGDLRVAEETPKLLASIFGADLLKSETSHGR